MRRDGLIVAVPPRIAELYTCLQDNPGDPQILSNLATAIDSEAGVNLRLREGLYDFVRERQRPSPLHLQVLGPDQDPDAFKLQAAFNRTLRIALAMRGGVSLAVWIGGCVAELDILRRLRIYKSDVDTDRAGEALVAFYLSGKEGLADDPLAAPVLRRAQAYASLLADARYDKVEFDILAGASAGGLNCILYSVAQMVGAAPDETILETWRSDGGLQELMRPPGRGRVKSILQGNEYFFPSIYRALSQIYRDDHRHQALIPEHLTIDLAATVLDSEPSRNPEVDEGRGSFHFEGRQSTNAEMAKASLMGNRIPTRNGASNGGRGPGTGDDAYDATVLPPGVTEDLARLAYAARATSSFPGAFEPATIYSREDKGGQRLLPRPELPDMRHAFGSHRAASCPADKAMFHVVDGGVFDNIPIGRALTAARGRLSERPAHRALLYLDPDTVRDSTTVSRGEDLSQFMDAVTASVLRLKRRESLDSEVNDYVEYVNVLSLNLGRSEVLAAVLSDGWSKEIGVERRRAYVRYRATSDVDRLTQLLTRPGEWQVASTVNGRRNFRAFGSEELSGFDAKVMQEYLAISRQDEHAAPFQLITNDAQALLDAAQCSFAWLRRMEVESFPENLTNTLTPFDKLRKGVYDVINRAITARDKAYWAVLEGSSGGDILHDKIISAWLSTAETGRLELTRSWTDLETHFIALLEYSQNLTIRAEDTNRAEPELRGWLETPWRDLTQMALTRRPDGSVFGVRDLAPTLAAAGIPPVVTRIRYWRIASDEQPGSAVDYRLLKAGENRSIVGLALKNIQPGHQVPAHLLEPDPANVPSRFKLAGNSMANFSGFLSKEWRENDWWWGRLDAASGISRFLETLSTDEAPRIPELDGDKEQFDESAGKAPRGSQNRVSWLQDRLVEQQFKIKDPSSESRRTARQSVRAGVDGPSDLSASYRLLLMSRGLRVLWRARPGGTVTTALGWLLHILFVPVFVLLPAIVHPARMAFILGFTYASLWVLARPENVGSGIQLILLWLLPLAVLLVIMGAATLTRGKRRWRAVLGELPENSTLLAECRGYSNTAAKKAWLGQWATVLLLVPFVLAVNQARPRMTIVCLVFMLALFLMTQQWANSVPALNHQKNPRLDQVLAAAGLVMAVGVPLVTELTNWSLPHNWLSLIVLAGALLVVALALTIGWLTVAGTLMAALVASAAGTLISWISWIVLEALQLGLLERTTLSLFFAFVAWGLVLWWMPENPRMVLTCCDAVVTVPPPVNP
ncbi:DUF3376 domain-containing protein [Pseudarthrobacter sulfonivorans]|uniref:DUF3376 domain-containing protein n=1 Tax=Pseudarthrobacter sulfonivorans TaxID=121292 RepID=UPI0012FDE4C3|nr:DUF3376 domain-containing protein [Pseudarthrobacter sulfonivorans]